MSPKAPGPHAFRVADLSQTGANEFDLRPAKDEMAAIAKALDLSALRKLSFVGRITPLGRNDWQINAKLGATVVQPCVVTLEPVTTRIDSPVERRFLADYDMPDEPEAEMPEDDTSEPLGAWIDPAAVMQEALALLVPDYPRKDDAALGQVVAAEPGVEPMTDEDAKPFAGLADFKAKLENGKE